jgi:uncharacterized OB-fold protein
MSSETGERAAVLQPNVTGIPSPRTSTRAAPYWEGCRRHELRYQRCTACGTIPPLPTPLCARCRSTQLTWERSEGRGELYSWTVVWRPQHPSFVVPYAPAIIRLSEGFTMMSAMVGCEPGDLAPALPVEVEFHALDDEITLPFFRPAG